VAAALAAAAPAYAQSAAPATALGDRGQLFITAERVVPIFAYSKDTSSGNQFSQSNTVSSISLLSYGVPSNIAYTVPRIGIDYALAPHITLGGAVAAFFDLSSSTTTTVGGMSMTDDNAKISGFLFTPRVGYLTALGPKLALWPRGGFSYYTESVSNPPNGGMMTSNGFHQFAIDLEANFLFAIAPHFMITLGPVIDIPVSGSTSFTNGNMTTSIDYSQFHFGITGGIGGYL
jgi:hypothetical protein